MRWILNLLAVAALLLAGTGCALVQRGDTLQVRQAVRYMDQGLQLEEAARVQHLEVLQEGWLRAINGEVDQALADDLRRLEAEGKLTQEAVQALAAEAAKLRERNTAAALELVKQAREAKVYRQLREVWAPLRAYILARLGQDEVLGDLAAQLERAAQAVGIDAKGGP